MADIRSLNPAKFNEFMASREGAIAVSSDAPKDECAVNRLARELHPSVQHLIVTDIVSESVDTKSYICSPDKESGTDACAYFAAGQYLSISVEIDGKKYSRPYSISSSPADTLRGIYRITVKRATGGRVSGYILDNFKVGTRFDASAPEGSFTYEPLRDAENVIALAGGSGITPFISMAKAIEEGDEDFNLTIIYGCRTEADILFKDELDGFESDRIKVVYALSDEERDGYERGFITSELIKKSAPSGEYSVFVCGPQAMTSFLSGELGKLDLRRKFIRFEVRGEAICKDMAGDTVNVTVNMRGGRVIVSGRSCETILRILENAGITPPTRCRSGECGFCRSRLISGEVYIPEYVAARRAADEKFGYIHPCCTYAKTDIEIEVSV